MKALSGINCLWGAQATRLCRPATRRKEWQQRFEPMWTAFSYALRASGRRVADRSVPVARATYFQTRSKSADTRLRRKSLCKTFGGIRAVKTLIEVKA